MFKETLGAVCESYSSIKGAVGEGVEQCKKRVLLQEKLSQEAQNSMMEILVRAQCGFKLRLKLQFDNILMLAKAK